MSYSFPPVNLLVKDDYKSNTSYLDSIEQKLKDVLLNFNIEINIIGRSFNSKIMRIEFRTTKGIRFRRILNLIDDIIIGIGIADIRIISVPDKNCIGIEIPRVDNGVVYFGNIVNSKDFQNNSMNIPFIVGENINGDKIIDDISEMPHLLIAGTTGSGKSVFINTLIMSLLYKLTPNDIRLILIDPKKVELSNYNDIPHLLCPVIIDTNKAIKSLVWVMDEMNKRYDLFLSKEVKNIDEYNLNSDNKLYKIVIIIDEFADLMLDAPEKFENIICRLSQMSRAAGIHLLIATQRPTVGVITGLIKSNMPSRISFATASAIDSRVILDSNGAEKLLGKGDMLYSPIGRNIPIRIQSCYISSDEISNTVSFIKLNNELVIYNKDILGNDFDKNKQKIHRLESTVKYFIGNRLATEEEVKSARWVRINGYDGLFTIDGKLVREVIY